MFKLFLFIISNIIFFLFGYKWVKENIHYSALVDSFAHIEISTMVLSSIPFILSLLVYGKRTSLLLKRSFKDSLSVNIIGHGLNNIFPFRLGELIKIILAKKFYSIGIYELSLLTLLEKSFDLIIISLLGFSIAYQFYTPSKLWLLIFLFITAIIVISCMFQGFNFKNLFFKKTYISSQFEKLNEAILRFNLKKNIILVFCYSGLIWMLNAAQYYFFFSKGVLSYSISITDAVTLLVITTLTFIIPVTPGCIGLFEGVMVYYLKNQCHLTSEKALALACVLHLLISIPQLLGMALCIVSQFFKRFVRSQNGNKKDIVLIHNCSID